MKPSVELLRYIVDKTVVHFDDQKVEKVRDGILLTTRKEFRSLLGLTLYYRRLILGYAKIAKQLNEKTWDKIEFIWFDQMQTAFEELKVKLISAPVLSYRDYEKHL